MPSYPFFCGKDCGGDACPLLAEVSGGQVTRIRHNPAAGPHLKGCRRGFDMPLWQNAPDRLLTPLIRVGPRGSGQFREASWDEALGLAAERLGEVRAKYGPQAVLNQGSAGDTGALHCTYTLLNRFLALFGGCTRLTGSYSAGAAGFILPYLLGSSAREAGFDPATMRHAAMIILWGANLLETRMGAEVPHRLAEARRRGAQVVVIDPRRSATAQRAADWWIAIRPGTDAAMMLAVLHVLLSEGLARREFALRRSVGFDLLERYVLGLDGGQARSPEWAAPICGVSAEEIARFARAYASADPAMLFPGYSIQRVHAGEEPMRLAVALQLATGNFGKTGGSTGAPNSYLPGPRVGRLPVPPGPEQPSLPLLRWPDAVLEGRAGGYPADIRAIYCLGSNFINQGADIRKNIAAFQKVDFAICHDSFLTPTARCCDVVLPSATAFEKEDIGLPWAGNYLLYRPRIVAPRGQARTDYEILCELADRLGFGEAFSEGLDEAGWVQRFLDESEVADQAGFRASGIYQAPEQERTGLADFARDPLAHPLGTPSGLVEIASSRFAADTGLPAIPSWQPAPEDPRYPLRLVTPKSPHRIHSQGSNLPEIQKKAAHAIEMHPADAARRGIQDGAEVRMFNETGEIRLRVRLSAGMAEGVVCLPEGVWLVMDEQGIERAGSANALTATTGTPASQSPIMHGVAVEVSPLPQRQACP